MLIGGGGESGGSAEGSDGSCGSGCVGGSRHWSLEVLALVVIAVVEAIDVELAVLVALEVVVLVGWWR